MRFDEYKMYNYKNIVLVQEIAVNNFILYEDNYTNKISFLKKEFPECKIIDEFYIEEPNHKYILPHMINPSSNLGKIDNITFRHDCIHYLYMTIYLFNLTGCLFSFNWLVKEDGNYLILVSGDEYYIDLIFNKFVNENFNKLCNDMGHKIKPEVLFKTIKCFYPNFKSSEFILNWDFNININ